MTTPARPCPSGPETASVRWLYLFGEPDEVIPEADASFGTDIGALRAGYVSVTPLSFAVGSRDLSAAFQSFLARLTDTFPLGNAMDNAHVERDCL